MKYNYTVKDIRTQNKINILKSIIINNGLTRNELAKCTKVSLMTITNVVDELLEGGYIYEVKTEATIGRTPSKLYIKKESGAFVCIDLTLSCASNYYIYDIKGNVMFSDTIAFDSRLTYHDNIISLFAIINKQLRDLSINILGIGLSVPGAYIIDTDTVKTKIIFEQQKINFKKLLSESFPCANVIIGNAANLAAKAEYNALNKNTSLFYIHIGEGIGGTYINRGEVIKGLDLIAGDLGQVLVPFNNKECTLGSIVSLPSIERNIKSDLNINTIDQAIEQYYNKNKCVVEYLDILFEVISRAIYNLAWLYNPEYIIINSYNNSIVQLLIENAEKYIESRNNVFQSAEFINTLIIPSSFRENPALRGLLSECIEGFISDVC